MKTRAAALLVAAGLVATARADERFAFATLENGTSVGFALVRTGEAGPSGSMGEAALPRSNSVSRVLWDRESGAYSTFSAFHSPEPIGPSSVVPLIALPSTLPL